MVLYIIKMSLPAPKKSLCENFEFSLEDPAIYLYKHVILGYLLNFLLQAIESSQLRYHL